jgi:hypothetical protein
MTDTLQQHPSNLYHAPKLIDWIKKNPKVLDYLKKHYKDDVLGMIDGMDARFAYQPQKWNNDPEKFVTWYFSSGTDKQDHEEAMKEFGKLKKEASVCAGVKGFLGGGPEMVRRKNEDSAVPFQQDSMNSADLFQKMIAMGILDDEDVEETVRKRGNQWVLYDDETDTVKSAYLDRDTAWDKQRIMRHHQDSAKKAKKSEKERQHVGVPRVDTPEKAKKSKEAPKSQKAPEPKKDKPKSKPQTRKEAFYNDMFSPITEGSMVSYVFENTPMSEESVTWESFIDKLSKQTVMSDPKLNKILHFIAKSELLCLRHAAETVKKSLEGSGHFEVAVANKIDRDQATNDFKLDFVVNMKDNNKKVKFCIKLDNNRPLLGWEDAKQTLDQLGNEESKLLRAELIHIQETTFKQTEDITSAIEKRDSYLKSMEQKFDKFLNTMGPLEMAMLKYLLKDKYKGVR